MADAQRTIELIFQGTDRTGAAAQSALSNTRNFAGGVENATQPIANLTTSALQLEAALLAGGAAMTTVAVIAAGQFDSAFREIDTLVDAPADALGRLRGELLEYATDSTQSLESITDATYSAISAGADYTDSVEALRTAEQLAVAGRADLNDSLTILVSSLNAYGLEMDQASRFSDILFTTVREGQTTLPELNASLSDVTSTAAALDVPFETLNAAIAALTATGIPTNRAVTSLNQALSALIAPTTQAKDVAEELGLEFDANAVRAEGLEGVLQNVAEATGGNEEQMRRLFGSTEALRGVLPLVGNAAGDFADTLEAMENNTGATARGYDEMADSVDNATQRLQNNVRVMLVEIGDPLLDEFGGIASAIANIFQTLGAEASGGELQELVDYVESTMGDLEDVFQRIAENLPAALEQADLSGFTGGVDAIRSAFADLFSEIDITTVEGLADAITLAGNAFEGLSQFVGGVITSFGPMFDYLVEFSENINTLNPDLAQTAGELAGFATQANALAGGLNSLLPVLEGLLGILLVRQGAGLVGAVGRFAGTLGGSTGLIALLGRGGLVGAAGAAGYALGSVLQPAVDGVVNAATEGESSLGTWIYELVNGEEEARVMAEALETTATGMDANARAAARTAREVEGLLVPTDQLTRSTEGHREALRTQNQAYVDSLLAARNSADGINDVADATENAAEGFIGTVPIIDEATGAIVGYEEGFIAGADATDALGRSADDVRGSLSNVSEETERAAEHAREMALAIVEADTEIAVANIEARATERVAELESRARRVEAAFESINTTIESTGGLIGDLFGQLGDADLSTRFELSDQIELENERRGDALRLQERLTEAEIANLNARTRAMESGDGIITIEGDGLQPHLEAFMWEIIRTIQVRVSQDGLEMLTGV